MVLRLLQPPAPPQCRRRTITEQLRNRRPHPRSGIRNPPRSRGNHTVNAPDIALHEIDRVHRPGGQLLYIEHVRSESPTLARCQDLLAAPWRRFARGCHCNKATGELIAASGLVPGPVRHAAWHAMPPIVRPLIIGQAHKPR